MKTKDFFDIAHAQRYLNNTIIRLDDVPIYVQGVTEGSNKKSRFVLKYNEVGDKEYKTVNIAHPKLNMNPVKLGWLAAKPKDRVPSVYLSRVPNRTWHVGLCVGNLRIHGDYRDDIANEWYQSCNFIAYSEALKDTIMGVYPSVEETIERAKEHPKKWWPFSRRFALHGDDLYYKYIDHPVGKLVQDGVMLTDTATTLLKEVLDEDFYGQPHH